MRSASACIISSSSSSARSDTVSGLACSFMSACLFHARLRHLFDRVDDGLIAGAAAVIARQMLADCVTTGYAAARQKLLRADQHAGRAIATLQRVPLLERRLQ